MNLQEQAAHVRSESDSLNHSTAALTIQTGARLHCGLFSDHRPGGKRFQGFGLMVSEPGFRMKAELRAARTPAAISGEAIIRFAPELDSRLSSETKQALPQRIQECLTLLNPLNTVGFTTFPVSLEIEIQQTIPQHRGLGSGTQLALATGKLWSHFFAPEISAAELSQCLNRGQRSCIGTFGFEQGGLLVDAGVQSAEERGSCRFAAKLPEEWRILLATPVGIQGLAGTSEREAFRKLPPIPASTLDHLLGLLEKLENSGTHFEAFSEIIREFGLVVGETFAPVQGGRFLHPRCETLFMTMEQAGLRGVAQSSWGPTLFGLCQHPSQAEAVKQELQKLPDMELQIVEPLNRGAISV